MRTIAICTSLLLYEGSRFSLRLWMLLAAILVICPKMAHAHSEDHCVLEERRSFRYQDFSASSIRILRPCAGGTKNAVVFVSYFSLSGMSMYVGRDFKGLAPASRRERLADRNSFLYDRLAQDLVSRGYTTIQYDAIASGCQMGEVASDENPFCVKRAESRRVIFSDFSSHLVSVLEVAFGGGAANSYQSITLVAFSGASKVVADFVQKQGSLYSGLPIGFVGVSPLIGPGAESIPHQEVGFWMSQLRACEGPVFRSCAESVLQDDTFRRNRTAEELRELSRRVTDNSKGRLRKIEKVLDSPP